MRLPLRFVLAAVLATGLALPALAQDVSQKRSEGRYFIELAEIMLSSEDFDILFAQDDPGGPRSGDPATALVAELPRNEFGPPMITFGLNRPSGKSAFSMSFYDFDLVDQRIPTSFDREGFVTTSNLLPAGIAFQRQAQPSSATGRSDGDDFFPNFGTESAHRLAVDHQVTDFTYERNVFENENFRLRWLGGLRYGRLKQGFGSALAFAPERGIAAGLERQDFFFALADIDTRGLGPKFGLDARWLLDKDKKWSIEARADIAVLPETTSATYQVNLADQSAEIAELTLSPSPGTVIITRSIVSETPVIPGVSLPDEAEFSTFSATLTQNDFTDEVYVATGRLGFRYQANRYFSVGVDLWQMRWMNVLSTAQMFAQINDEATFELIPPTDGPAVMPGEPPVPNPNPELQDFEAIVHVGRFDRREDFVFDGINLNLGFQF